MKKFFLYLFLISSLTLFVVTVASPEESSEPLCGDKTGEMLKAIKERQRELDMMEERIRVKEERLKGLKEDITNRIDELTRIRERLEKILQEIRGEKKQGLEKLAKVYENMPPEEAALRIERLESRFAVMLLKTMKSKVAGKILAFVEPSKAARLTQELGRSFIKNTGF